MSSADATPSSTIRIASSAIATPRRLLANPGESRTVIACLPRPSTHSCALPTKSGAVRAPTTTSTRSLAGTGLKKCSPMRTDGSGSAEARASIGNELVFVPITALGAQRAMVASTACFTSGSSGTASTTRAECANAAGSTTTSTVPVAVMPSSADLARLFSTRARAAAAARSSFSTTVTALPATANAWAIPAPIRPPP